MFTNNFQLIHPSTNELVAIFQGYADSGGEIWLTPNGIEECIFEGFTDNGWTKWSQPISQFVNTVNEQEE